jgi:hypothetical protein
MGGTARRASHPRTDQIDSCRTNRRCCRAEPSWRSKPRPRRDRVVNRRRARRSLGASSLPPGGVPGPGLGPPIPPGLAHGLTAVARGRCCFRRRRHAGGRTAAHDPFHLPLGVGGVSLRRHLNAATSPASPGAMPGLRSSDSIASAIALAVRAPVSVAIASPPRSRAREPAGAGDCSRRRRRWRPTRASGDIPVARRRGRGHWSIIGSLHRSPFRHARQ